MNKITEESVDLDFEVIENEQLSDEDELFEHFSYEVDKGQAITRIDKFLCNRMESISRSRIQTAADAGTIYVNDKKVKSNYKVKPLDKVSVILPYPPRNIEMIAEDIPINIVYEDSDLMIINKDAGMVVHPGHGNYTGTLMNALTFYLKNTPLFQEGNMRAGLVHRIDKNTSGLLVIAKNEHSHTHLAKQFFNHTIQRKYHALVWGNFEEENGTVIGNIARSLKNRMKMEVFEPDSGIGKHAITHYRVLERLGYVTLIECQLETGRTHQIRVHMEKLRHPMFNDERYGGDDILRGTTFTKYKQFVRNCFEVMPRHGLHAKSLGFIHPTSGKEMFFESDIATDMQQCIDKWRGYVATRDIE